MQTIRLPLQLATPETIAPFGSLLAVPAAKGEALPVAFYEGSVEVYKPSIFVSDHETELNIARVNRRKPEVQWMERHFKHTQTFIPMGGRPFVMVLAPPTEDDIPDPASAKALLFDGSGGFCMDIGVWHEFPFALADDTHVVVVLRSEATKSLMKSVVHDGEASGGDIDKKDIQRRLSVTLEPIF